MLKNFDVGANITLLDTIYESPRNKNGKWDNGSITLVYVDLDTNKKYNETIYNPTIDFYVNKKGNWVDYNETYQYEENLDKITVPYNNVTKEIAKIYGESEKYFMNIKSGNRRANKKFHEKPNIFRSDVNIQDYYRFKFSTLYKNNSFKPSKMYFDIECDTIDIKGDFPELGESPVNAISSIFKDTCYTFLLTNSSRENDLIPEFIDSLKDKSFFEDLDIELNKAIGSKDNFVKYKLTNMKYEVFMFDDELSLIRSFFKYVNKEQPDFALAWNIAFDIRYLIERLKILGENPIDYICHPEFELKVCSYHVDEFHKNDKENARGDYAKISAYTVYIDQQIQFASRRKGNDTDFINFKLDTIGDVITSVRKLDYSHITTSIAKLPYLNYKIFVIYNIIDTIVQKCIEETVGDIDFLFRKCLMNNTRYSKAYRQTIYLVNRFMYHLYLEGKIMGNNINNKSGFNHSDDEDDDIKKKKYPGAIVANPVKIHDYPKYKIDGKFPIDIYDNLDDYDYKSLYPNIMMQTNVGSHAQIGRIYINSEMNGVENKYNNSMYFRGGSFLDDFHSNNWLEFCNRWLYLASYDDLLDDVIRYNTLINPTDNNIMYDSTNKKPMFKKITDRTKSNSKPKLFTRIVNPCSEELKKSLIDELKNGDGGLYRGY